MRSFLSFCALLFVLSFISSTFAYKNIKDIPFKVHPKKLAGPPSEFGLHETPEPSSGYLTSSSQSIHIHLGEATIIRNGLTWSMLLNADSSTFSFSVLTPIVEKLLITFIDPNGDMVDLTKYTQWGNYPLTDDNSTSIVQKAYYFENMPTGEYSLLLVTKESLSDSEFLKYTTNAKPDGILLWWTSAPIHQYSHLTTYQLQLNTDIGVTALIYDQNEWTRNQTRPSAKLGVVQKAVLKIELPDGNEEDIEMKDDGLNGDLKANDGEYLGTFKATEVGSYILRTELSGSDSAGSFVRTVTRLITVVDSTLQLSGRAHGTVNEGDNKMKIDILVSGAKDGDRFRTYAQFWGRDEAGNIAPACWVGTISAVVESSGSSSLPMELQVEWIAKAQLSGPYILKNVVVYDVDTNIPIAQASEMGVWMEGSVEKVIQSLNLPEHIEITDEMRMGKNPIPHPKVVTTPRVVLTHGYCSQKNPWAALSPQVFPANSLFFLQPKVSLSNDEFALNILSFIQSNSQSGDTFSLVGHSQGGLAILHLYNYYFSEIDFNTVGRVLQSVGSPYNGNSGAGAGADLINIFGIGCGANDALTKDGAKLWLSGISTNSRSKVYYYTTQYKECFACYCAPGVGLVLDQPNDGTAERDLSQLSGANNMGNMQGQCHTEGMNFQAQCQYQPRNEEMARNAISEPKRKF